MRTYSCPKIWSLAVVVMVTGCGSTGTLLTEVARRTAEIETVVVLLNYLGLEGRAVEQDIVTCISDGIRRRHPNLRVIPPDEFRRTAFPDLAAEAAPRSPQYLGMLLNTPLFRQRIAPLRLRYLILVGGATDVKTSGGEIMAAIPPSLFAPGVAHLGAWVSDRTTHLVASILDVKNSRAAGEVTASASGTSTTVVIQFLPLKIPAGTEDAACVELGGKVATFLAGEPSSR